MAAFNPEIIERFLQVVTLILDYNLKLDKSPALFAKNYLDFKFKCTL